MIAQRPHQIFNLPARLGRRPALQEGTYTAGDLINPSRVAREAGLARRADARLGPPTRNADDVDAWRVDFVVGELVDVLHEAVGDFAFEARVRGEELAGWGAAVAVDSFSGGGEGEDEEGNGSEKESGVHFDVDFLVGFRCGNKRQC